MKNRVIESVISALLFGFMTFIANSTLSYFTGNNGIVRINEPIEIEQGKYEMTINIDNFSSTNLDKIRIMLPYDTDTNNIRCSKPLNIIKIPSNLGKDNGSVFEINRISENQKADILFLVDKRIDINSISIEKNANKIEIQYPNDINSPLQKDIYSTIIMSICYALIFGILTYYTERKRDIRIAEFKEYSDRLDKEITDLKQQADKLEIQHNKEANTYKKQLILQLARLRDYSKELDFWRDTIRKITYKSTNGNINSESIINTITTTLKTYQTKKSDEENFETINMLANMLNNTLETKN